MENIFQATVIVTTIKIKKLEHWSYTHITCLGLGYIFAPSPKLVNQGVPMSDHVV